MKILHITPNSDGYEIVKLLANRISRNNYLSLIEKDNGEISMTGGFILNDTPEIRKILNDLPNDKQYEFVKSFKIDPWVRSYADEQYGDLAPIKY